MIHQLGMYTQIYIEANVFSESENSETDVKRMLSNILVEAYSRIEIRILDQDTDNLNSY